MIVSRFLLNLRGINFGYADVESTVPSAEELRFVHRGIEGLRAPLEWGEDSFESGDSDGLYELAVRIDEPMLCSLQVQPKAGNIGLHLECTETDLVHTGA